MREFFEKKGPFLLQDIIKLIKCNNIDTNINKKEINNINNLVNAKDNEITFFNSIKYKEYALKTNAIACVTSEDLKKYIPRHCCSLIVKNVLLATTLVSKKFYPNADVDFPDSKLLSVKDLNFKYINVVFGKNV